MRHRILLAAAGLYLIVANLIWIARDTRPPFWDTACHETLALRVYDAFVMAGMVGLMKVLPGLTGYYPPLYHLVVALFFGVFGKSVSAAQLANLPAILLLLAATYGIGVSVLSRTSAAAAAVLANFYPLMLWLSRETMIDYWLTSMVAVSIWLLVARKFESVRWSVVIGIVCALGMFTKWTFGFFVVLPFLWFARRNVRNAGIAAAVAGAITMYWYVPQIQALRHLLYINNAGGVGEGDPNPLSFQAVVFYIRALEGYQIFLPLFAAFIAGIVVLRRRFDQAWVPVVLWLIGGWLSLMLFRNKDPRYSVPLLPAVALITANIFESRPVLLPVFLPIVLFQHYLVSFGVRRLPEKVVLMEGVKGPLSYDWNLYTQTYFGLWGPAAREDWKIQHVLDTVSAPGPRKITLGLAPNIARFDPVAFEFYIALQNRPVVINRLSHYDEGAIANNDFVVVTEENGNEDGFESVLSPDLRRINDYVFNHPDSFHMVERFALPNGVGIRLYRVGV
jgi:4-amino-4-deoxy-L-arabinose transferase-like glycosyltransferase